MTKQENEAQKRRGRPRKAVADGERKSIAFRVGPELYDWLVQVSETSGDSISRIVEKHLENQMGNVGRHPLDQVFIGQSRSTEMLRHYALIFAAYDRLGDWTQDDTVRAGILGAFAALNDRLIPLDTSSFGAGADASAPKTAELDAAWGAGAQLGSLLASPLSPAILTD